MSDQPPYGYNQGGGYPPPPPGSPSGKTKVMNLDYNVAGMLCYLPICCVNLIFSIIWLASEPKENRFLRFHALQSLLLIGAAFVVFIILGILGFATAVAPGPAGSAGWGLITLIEWAFSILLLVVAVLGCVKAYQGAMWKLPIIGDIAEKNS